MMNRQPIKQLMVHPGLPLDMWQIIIGDHLCPDLQSLLMLLQTGNRFMRLAIQRSVRSLLVRFKIYHLKQDYVPLWLCQLITTYFPQLNTLSLDNLKFPLPLVLPDTVTALVDKTYHSRARPPPTLDLSHLSHLKTFSSSTSHTFDLANLYHLTHIDTFRCILPTRGTLRTSKGVHLFTFDANNTELKLDTMETLCIRDVWSIHKAHVIAAMPLLSTLKIDGLDLAGRFELNQLPSKLTRFHVNNIKLETDIGFPSTLKSIKLIDCLFDLPSFVDQLATLHHLTTLKVSGLPVRALYKLPPNLTTILLGHGEFITVVTRLDDPLIDWPVGLTRIIVEGPRFNLDKSTTLQLDRLPSKLTHWKQHWSTAPAYIVCKRFPSIQHYTNREEVDRETLQNLMNAWPRLVSLRVRVSLTQLPVHFPDSLTHLDIRGGTHAGAFLYWMSLCDLPLNLQSMTINVSGQISMPYMLDMIRNLPNTVAALVLNIPRLKLTKEIIQALPPRLLKLGRHFGAIRIDPEHFMYLPRSLKESDLVANGKATDEITRDLPPYLQIEFAEEAKMISHRHVGVNFSQM